MDIALRGTLVDNDSADVLRYWGWRDIVSPMDIAQALDEAGGEDVTLLVNSGGGSLPVGNEIYSILRRYQGKTEALVQGMAASAATVAMCGCSVIRSEPGALLCYHNPSLAANGDWQVHKKTAEELKNCAEAVLNIYEMRSHRTREQLAALLDKDKLISPQQAMEYGLIDEIVGMARPGEDPEGLELVAAHMGAYPRVTAEMREKYQAHRKEEQDRMKEETARARAKIRALAAY